MDYKTAPRRFSKLLGVDMVLDTKGAETQMRWWQDCFGSCRKLPDRLFFLVAVLDARVVRNRVFSEILCYSPILWQKPGFLGFDA